MIEARGDLWTYGDPDVSVRVITTNGYLKNSDGALVMGRGCAQEARDRWLGLDLRIGALIRDYGWERTYALDVGEPWLLMTFPVKPAQGPNGEPGFKAKAELEIIERSAAKLVSFANIMREVISGLYLIPRPGCGNGGLRWEDVKSVLAPILDDRFVIIER